MLSSLNHGRRSGLSNVMFTANIQGNVEVDFASSNCSMVISCVMCIVPIIPAMSAWAGIPFTSVTGHSMCKYSLIWLEIIPSLITQG